MCLSKVVLLRGLVHLLLGCRLALCRAGAAGAPGEEPDEALLLQVRKNQEPELAQVNATSEVDWRPKTLKAYVVPVNSQQPAFPGPRGEVKTALAFSGGGARSLSLCMGQYRALEKLGILPHGVDAVSSVSGGTWAASQYFYVELDSAKLLGTPQVPLSNLTMTALNQTPPAMGARVIGNTTEAFLRYGLKSVARCMLFKKIRHLYEKCKKSAAKNAWITVIASLILGEYKLDADAYLAPSKESVQSIVSRNPGLNPHHFIVPRSDRPKTLVMNGALLAPLGYASTGRNVVSLQMSPDYIGSPFIPNDHRVFYFKDMLSKSKGPELDSEWVGGGFVESFAFGGKAPSPTAQQGSAEPVTVGAPDVPFSLADAVGISSAAFAALLTKSVTLSHFNPENPYWPVVPEGAKKGQSAKTYTMGDGAVQENFGFLAMLQSKAERVVIFINTAVPLSSEDLCNLSAGEDLTDAASSDLSCLFGHCTQTALDKAAESFQQDKVFAKTDYTPLLCALQMEKQSGKTAIAKQSLKTVANEWWGIPAGHEVEIIFVYNEYSSNFVSSLPAETQAEIKKGDDGAFAGFPRYSTVFQNPPNVVGLTPAQVNLLAAHGEFAIYEHSKLFCDLLGCIGQAATTHF